MFIACLEAKRSSPTWPHGIFGSSVTSAMEKPKSILFNSLCKSTYCQSFIPPATCTFSLPVMSWQSWWLKHNSMLIRNFCPIFWRFIISASRAFNFKRDDLKGSSTSTVRPWMVNKHQFMLEPWASSNQNQIISGYWIFQQIV